VAWGSRVEIGGTWQILGQSVSSVRFRRHRCCEAVQWAWEMAS